MTRSALPFCLLAAIPVTGCDQNGSPFKTESIKTATVEGKIRSRRSGGEEIRVWRDPETGCQYLLWERRRMGAMTPRLTAGGQPMCSAS